VAKDGSLEHLDISVSDLERSGAFWAAFLKDLGYREFAKSATGWSWTNDESTVFLLQAESGYLDPPYHRKRVGLNHLAFSVSDPKQVDAMATRLKERNIPLLYGGPRTGRTTYAVFFEDPDRIKIEVVAPLAARTLVSPPPLAGEGRVGAPEARSLPPKSSPTPAPWSRLRDLARCSARNTGSSASSAGWPYLDWSRLPPSWSHAPFPPSGRVHVAPRPAS